MNEKPPMAIIGGSILLSRLGGNGLNNKKDCLDAYISQIMSDDTKKGVLDQADVADTSPLIKKHFYNLIIKSIDE